MGVWLPALLPAVVPPGVRAADAALVIGVGAVRLESSGGAAGGTGWETRVYPEARGDAEAVFRRLIPETRLTPSLYARGPRWYETGTDRWDAAALLTDAVTDNAAIPSGSVLLWECRRLGRGVSPPERFLIFVAAPGDVRGPDTWFFGRLGRRVELRTLLADLPEGPGPRWVIARMYPPMTGTQPHTLVAVDATTARTLRDWATAASARADALQPASAPPTLLPGLDERLVAVSPTRTTRLCDRLEAPATDLHRLSLFDLGQTLEPVRHRLEYPITVREVPIYRTIRRPGPLFTIVEIETNEQIGSRHEFDHSVLAGRLTTDRVARDSAGAIAARVQTGIADSFRDTLTRPEATYQITYNKTGPTVTVEYDD